MSSLASSDELKKAWTTDAMICGLVNGDGDICYHRCYLNAVVQLLSGVPDILTGLQSVFASCGATDIWPASLARGLHEALKQVISPKPKVGAKHKIANIENFVKALKDSKDPAVNCLVRRVSRTRHVLEEQDPEEVIRFILGALQAEACDIFRQTFPEADDPEAKLFYSRFSASTFTQVACPYAYICESITEVKPTPPAVIEIPKLFVDGGVDGGMDGGVEDGVGATVEQLFDKCCSPSVVKEMPCLACVGLFMPEPWMGTRLAWMTLPDVFILAIGREQQPEVPLQFLAAVGKSGSGRSHTAVNLQEEVTLVYGSERQLAKDYIVNRIILYTGESSKGGHFTVAVRQQRNGQYHPGDLWQYLNSGLPAVTCTLKSLRDVHRRNVTGLLLVAKPIIPAEPLPTIPAGPLPTLEVSRSSSSGVGVGHSGDDSSSRRIRISNAQEHKRKQELATARRFDVSPMVAAAAQKEEAKLARLKLYKSSATSQSSAAATLPWVVAALHSAEPPAKLSAKEQKAALKKLNKERKKTPLSLGGAVYNAHPSRATAAVTFDVSGAVTFVEDSATPAAASCAAAVHLSATDLAPAVATAVEAEVSVEPVAMSASVPATAADMCAEPGVSEVVTAAEDVAAAIPCEIFVVEQTPAPIPATDVTSAVVTAVEAMVSAEPAGNMASVPATAADTSVEDGECEAISSAEDLATPSPPNTSAAEVTAACVSAADVTSAVATAVEAEVAAKPSAILAIVPATAAHISAVPGVSGVVTSIKDSATPAAVTCAVETTVQILAAANTPAAATAAETQSSAEAAADMATVPATAAETSAEDSVFEAITCAEDAATPATETCAAGMTVQIPAAATAMEAEVSTAAKMSNVLATSADIRAIETVATTVKAEVTAEPDVNISAAPAEISVVETVATAVEAKTVSSAQPSQTLLPVKIRLAGSSQIGTDSQVDTPDMGEVALAQGSPFSSAEGCATEPEHEELGSFPVDCSEYEAEELSTSQADASEDKSTKLSSHPVMDEEDKSEYEFEEELSSSQPSLVNRAKEWLSCPSNRVAVAGVVGAGCCCLLACLSRRR